ncbi:methylated-DNA-[protein]-cysteine S-methyltransferase [Streptomyces sp. CG 926]|uniref:methylated-DNA--[protein]-cysteine S-methyltransferase n=1 Tax=Streptomyces sp. CG 926 TaxID=1882405 RepID=UPI000D6C544D|nr:methylated-DNA--[protein]-cysteine S-methyltransferase [Streptomyces sp. CG 926]PWK72232.1 methylated-DNA-[protein]-cysteine S-methyltransferase [Streptomyces sp. CG 926]
MPTPGPLSAATATVAVHPTILGPLVLAATDDALVLCCYDTTEAAAERLGRGGLRPAGPGDGSAPGQKVLDEAREQIDAYLAGTRRDFTVATDLRLATPFSRRTNLMLAEFVPYGSTATYADLARALERPGAARAVGTALGNNPLCVVLPCHRIIGSTGSLSGYAGGLEAKRHLLALEAAGAPAA